MANESKNPKSALNAILETEKKVDEVVVYPLTIGRMALLELLDSPFLNNERKLNLANCLPSVFTMTQDINFLSQYNEDNISILKRNAMIWAEEISPTTLNRCIDEIMRKLTQVNEVSPDAKGENGGNGGGSEKN